MKKSIKIGDFEVFTYIFEKNELQEALDTFFTSSKLLNYEITFIDMFPDALTVLVGSKDETKFFIEFQLVNNILTAVELAKTEEVEENYRNLLKGLERNKENVIYPKDATTLINRLIDLL